MKPACGADLHHRVDRQLQELATPQAGAGEKLDGQTRERIISRAGGLDQLLRGAVVDEARQRIVELCLGTSPGTPHFHLTAPQPCLDGRRICRSHLPY
jgi:hypothetical protein